MPLINRYQQLAEKRRQIIDIHTNMDHDNITIDSQAEEILLQILPIDNAETGENTKKNRLIDQDIILEQWKKLDHSLNIVYQQKTATQQLGIVVAGDIDIKQISDFLPNILSKVAIIVVKFPSFRDGRGYSLAKNLQNAPNFPETMVLRAVGDILPDTLVSLTNVGFTEFEIDNPNFHDGWFDYFQPMQHHYTGQSVYQLPMFTQNNQL